MFREKSDADLPFLAVKYKNGMKPMRQMNSQGKMVVVEPSEHTKFLPPHEEDAAIIDME